MKLRLKDMLLSARQAAIDLLFPTGVECLVCGAPSRGAVLCEVCRHALDAQWIPEPRCRRCGGALRDGVCDLCAQGWTLRGATPWRHGGVPRTLVHRLKFSAYEAAAEVLAEGMAEAAQSLAPGGNTVLTWVPMRPEKLRVRGIDHARLLAERTAERLGLRCEPLLENRNALEEALESQVGRGGMERRSRKLAFIAKDALPGRVILVDDVLTTGTTLLAASTPLLARGAEVSFLTATRADH